jgi:sporulation protein YlmC with PRC-barrel domain
MKKINFMAILAISFSLLLAGAVFAGGGMTKAGEGGPQAGQAVTSGEFISVDKLTGMDVRNRDGKSIGEVSAYQLDEGGNIRFLVVSTGGVFGIGAKERLVPYTAFKAAEAADALILTVDESLLASSPAKTPDMTDEQYSRGLYEHYGLAPYWGTESEAIPEATPEQ